MTYERIREKHSSFTVSARAHERDTERYTIDEPEDEDPRPSFGPLRVVVADGECVEETSKPYELAKCRQVTPVRLPKKVS